MGGIWISLTTAIRSWSSVPMHFRRATSISPNSYWACPSIEQLIRTMKGVYRGGRTPDTTTARKAVQAQSDALRLRWADVASRVERFIDYLGNRPVMTRKLRLGWVSTYNARCGI